MPQIREGGIVDIRIGVQKNHTHLLTVQNYFIYQEKCHTMVPSLPRFSQSEISPFRRSSAAPDSADHDHTLRQVTQSFHESLIRGSGSATRGGSAQFGGGGDVGSSFENPRSILSTNDVEKDTISMLDNFFDHCRANESRNSVCTINSCNRSFTSKTALLQHQSRDHGSPTGYVCPICSASFTRSNNLKKHVRCPPSLHGPQKLSKKSWNKAETSKVFCFLYFSVLKSSLPRFSVLAQICSFFPYYFSHACILSCCILTNFVPVFVSASFKFLFSYRWYWIPFLSCKNSLPCLQQIIVCVSLRIFSYIAVSFSIRCTSILIRFKVSMTSRSLTNANSVKHAILLSSPFNDT